MKNKTNIKAKTTVNIEPTIKKLAQVYAINSGMTLGEVIEEALKEFLVTQE